MTTPTAGPDLAGLSYEQARDELVGVVQRLEAGSLTLEDSLSLWERGEALANRCQEWLDGARERLDAARSDVRPSGSGDKGGVAGRPDASSAVDGTFDDDRSDDPSADDTAHDEEPGR